MACTNIRQNSELSKCEFPIGNTYEITIKEKDRIIVTVETEHLKAKPKTTFEIVGIGIDHKPDGRMLHKVDWSTRNTTDDL
jgi:hypothetical protein